MLVSVIIPVYNGSNFLERVYKSICEQSYNRIEIIFFNDNSNDDSLKKIQSFQKKNKKVKVYSSKKNMGPGGAKNEGLKHATGDYILFIDCDDYISKDFIANLVENAKINQYPDIILSDFTKVDENENIIYIRNYKNKEKAFYQKITSWGKLIKTNFIKNNKLQLPYGHVLEDILFHAALVLSNPSYSYINESGYYYVCNKNSITHTSMKSFKPNSLYMSEKYLVKIKDNKNIINKEDLCYFAFKYVCWYLLKSGNMVGTQAMKKEYQNAFDFLTKKFPDFKKIKFKKFKYERTIIKVVLFNILFLNKIHLDKFFFQIYSNINLEKFWPKL